MTMPQGPAGPGPHEPTSQRPQQGPDGPTQHLPQFGDQGRPRGSAQAPPVQSPPPFAPQGSPPFAQQGLPPNAYGGAGQGFGPPNHSGRPRAKVMTAIWALAAVSVIAVVCGLSISEDGHTAWDSVHAWGAVAILGALLTAAPAVGAAAGVSPQRAWQVAACGAGALVLFWVLFVLPAVGSNTSLATTVGVAAGVVAGLDRSRT